MEVVLITFLLTFFPAVVLQHAPDLLPLLEPSPPLPRQHLSLPLPAARLPLADSGRPPLHAAAAHLAGALVLLSPGDLRTHGLFTVPGPHVGVRAQSATGLPRLDRPHPSFSRQAQDHHSLLTVIALFHHSFLEPDSDIFCCMSTQRASIPPGPPTDGCLLSFSRPSKATSQVIISILFLGSIVYLICMLL